MKRIPREIIPLVKIILKNYHQENYALVSKTSPLRKNTCPENSLLQKVSHKICFRCIQVYKYTSIYLNDLFINYTLKQQKPFKNNANAIFKHTQIKNKKTNNLTI